MNLYLSPEVIQELKTNINSKLSNGTFTLNFYSSVAPTEEQANDITTAPTVGLLHSLEIDLTDGSLTDGEIKFTPDNNGTCIWGLFGKDDEYVIFENILDSVVLADTEFNSDQENTVSDISCELI